MRHLILLLILTLPLTLAAERITLTEENVAEELSGMDWSSVGLVMISRTKRKRQFTTGFFLDETHFLASEMPLAEEDVPYCTKATVIFAGLTKVALDFEGTNFAATHTCEKVLRKDVWRGYSLWKVAPVKASSPPRAPRGLTLLTEEAVEKTGFQSHAERFRMVGFALSGDGNQLISHTGCREHHASSPFTDEDLGKYAPLKKVKYLWGSFDCPYEEGLLGSPILHRYRNQWYVVGMVSGLVPPSLLLSPLFVSLTALYGSKLYDAEAPNNGDEE